MKPHLTAVKNTLLAFPTPIRTTVFEKVEEFNAELAKKIMAMRETQPTTQYSNVGGWHGPTTFLQDVGEPFGTRLAGLFSQEVRATLESLAELTQAATNVAVTGWANVNMRGDSNSSHIHPGFIWSGVYYVATDTKLEADGNLVFTDPRTAALMLIHPLNPFHDGKLISLIPKPGMMVVFPSFLYHRVQIYKSDTPRISIGFNLR